MTIADRLRELNITVPAPMAPAGSYVGAVQSGNLVFISGHGPRRDDGTFVAGKVGREVSVEEAQEAAKLTTLQCLAALQATIGDLDRVARIVKLLVMVNCTEDFEQHPTVANGSSDLLVALFGESGRHARSAVGMQMLPFNIAVEIEMVVEVQIEPGA